MNIKIYNKVLTLAATALLLGSCDKIAEDERFTEVTDINPDRKVLVEEFTGQFCPNCPLGHEALDNIAALYGDNSVIVSVHAGDMAFDDPEYGLKTPEGDTYAKQWNEDHYPFAVVNRTSGALVDRSLWQGAVFNAARIAPQAKIELAAMLTDDKIEIASTLTAEKNDMTVSYQLWIVEDSIVGMQLDGEEYRMDYVHNHVYRASVNGIGGESILVSTEGTDAEHTIALDERWNPKNLKVVGFLYNETGVIQAEEIKIEK